MRATELRKNLYQTLERASQGESIAIEYKGISLRLEAVPPKSKLANAVRRKTIIGDPSSIIGSDQELMDYLEKKWALEHVSLCDLAARR